MIDINIAFIFQVINFLLLMIVLNFLLYRPLRRVLGERAGAISGAREKAEEVDREVQEKMADYEARLREMRSHATADRNALKGEAAAEEARIVEAARKEADGALASIRTQVAKETADARALLKEQASAISLEICQKVLGRSL
ncbi:MAG: ATP synthase F0 subunit B [Geobacter sp.]|nr:ATP synthase F0 subunit B [Geobacter sp.]